MAAGQFQVAAAFAFASTSLALEFVSPVAMIFRLRFGNIDHHVVLELARRLQSLAAAAGALLQLHVVLLHLIGRNLVELGRLAKRARMLVMPLRAAVLPLGFGRRLAIRLRLVPLALQPQDLGFQLGNPRIARVELLPQLRHPPQQRGHLLLNCCDIFHDAYNFIKISFPAKSNLA